MKHNLPTIGLLVLLGATATVATATELDLRRHIEVEGTARVEAEVDILKWHFTFRAEAPELAAAVTEVEAAVAALEERLEGIDLESDALRFSRLSSSRVYETEHDRERDLRVRRFKGYSVTRRAVITTRKAELSHEVDLALLADHRLEIDGLHTASSQHDALRREAILLAVAAARDKAGQMAVALGAELGPVLAVQESSATPVRLTENRIEMPAFGQRGSDDFERISLSATVRVKFELK